VTRATDHFGRCVDDPFTMPFACTPPAIHATQERKMHDGGPPAPFLDWTGGKRRRLPRILELAPSRIDTYCFSSPSSASLTPVGT